jgi:hypothetical protein
MSLTKVSYSMIDGAAVNVKDFGAVGDGVADDRAAIQAAIDFVMAQGYGGEIWFPQGQYRVTDTIQMIGDYTAANQPRGIRLVGAMGTQNLNPSTANAKDVSSNTYIFGDGIATNKPVFYCWGGHNNTFEHLCIAGARAQESATQAFACVWVDFNHENYRFYDCKFVLAPIGIRVCSSYNHTTTAWTPGVSAYDGTTFIPNTLVGGFASDNHRYENCSFNNSIAGISIESAQALDMVSTKCIFFGTTGIFIAACQGISIYDPTFLNLSKAGIYLSLSASTGKIVTENSHLEGGVLILFDVDTINPGGQLGNGITFNTCGGGDVNVRGASGTITINNSILRTVSMKSAGPSLIIRNTTFASLNKTAALGPGERLVLEYCTIQSVSANWNAYTIINVDNCAIAANSDLFYAKKIGAPNLATGLVLGSVNATSTVDFMEGVSFANINNNALFLGYGCYQDGAGTIIATDTTGGYAIFNNAGITLKKFTGATIGTTPVVTAGAYA